MTKSYILAMDIAQQSAVVQLSGADGTKLWRGTVPTDLTGWQRLEQLLVEHQVRASELLVIAEATGIYHLAWAERLTQSGARVYVLNPLLASRLESVANALRQHKTDEVDVGRLTEAARLYAGQLTRFHYQSDPAQQALRQLDHVRGQLRATLTNLKKSLQSHLELVFPALLAANIAFDSVRAGKILQVAATAGTWLALPLAARQKLAGPKQTALDHAATRSLADEAIAQACVPAVRTLLAAQQAIADQLHGCEQDIAARRPAERVGLIMSIPGFGERTGTVWSIYLPASFAGWGGKKQITARLQAFCGIDPRLRRSGKWTGQTKISKRGITSARTALFQSAFCSLRSDPENAAYYAKLRARGKAHKQAIVDLMRKQLRRLVAVLYSHRPYVPSTPHLSCAAA